MEILLTFLFTNHNQATTMQIKLMLKNSFQAIALAITNYNGLTIKQ